MHARLIGIGRRFARPTAVALSAGAAALLGASSHDASPARTEDARWQHSAGSDRLPTHSLAEVAKHNTLETGVWVTFRGGVYDITSFIQNHPGGVDKILTAAGGSLEPFWALYRQHVQPSGSSGGGLVPKDHVADVLGPLQIGWLDPAEAAKLPARSADDPYANEPTRHPALRLLSETPCSGESPAHLMADSWVTPNALFFVRNHHPVPVMDEKTFKLEVSLPGGKSVTYTLDQLRAMPATTVAASLQCGGNRRGELNSVRKTSGNAWGFGAISNARWTGVRLRDVLVAAGVPADEDRASAAGIGHVQFEGHDGTIASIPVHKATSNRDDVLLAYEMKCGVSTPTQHVTA